MMKYISLAEQGNSECPNIGVIAIISDQHEYLESKFKEAVEAHFDDEMVRYEFTSEFHHKFDACVGKYPMEVNVFLGKEENEYTVELSETWLY